MPKVTGPLFSVDARGALGDGICFLDMPSGPRVIKSPRPRNPNSTSQALHRTSFQDAKDAWKDLSAASKAAYNAEAEGYRMTGYNLWLKRTLTGEVAIPTWHEDSLERLIPTGNDDVELAFSTADIPILDYTWPRVIAGWEQDGVYRCGFNLRWTNITIPQGATILTAHIDFQSRYNDIIDTCNTQFCGDYQDNPPQIASIADFQSRRGTDCGGPNNNNRTVAEVNWDALPHWTNPNIYTSPDLSAIVQEIVNRPGWAYGNALALFWDDHKARSSYCAIRQSVSRNYSATECPKLYITYRWLA